MTKTLKQHQKELGIKGGSATFKKHGAEHYIKMRATAGAKMYFQGMLDGMSVHDAHPSDSVRFRILLIEALADKNYEKLTDHRILGQFYKK